MVKHSTTEEARAPLQAQLKTGLHAERKGIPKTQENSRASKVYKVTTSVPSIKVLVESYMVGTIG